MNNNINHPNSSHTTNVQQSSPPQEVKLVTNNTMVNKSVAENKPVESKVTEAVVDEKPIINDTLEFKADDPKVDEYKAKVDEFDKFVKEFDSNDIDESTIVNSDKIVPCISLSNREAVEENYKQKIMDIKSEEEFNKMQSDMISDINVIRNSYENLTANSDLLLESLSAVELDKLKRSINSVGDSSSLVGEKFKNRTEVTLSGPEAMLTMATLSGGVRRVVLWNSGITVNLRRLSLDALNNYYRNLSLEDNEYGKQFGGFYYLYSDIAINEYIVRNLLPLAICGSNYTHWRDTKALMKVIAWQDYHTILWALGATMYPNGVDVRFVCSEENCTSVITEKVDATKMRLLNTDIISNDMTEHFKSTKSLSDADIEKYQSALNMDRTVTFTYEDDGIEKQCEVVFQQAAVDKFLEVGNDFIMELRRHCSPTEIEEVRNYTTYNRYRMVKPWIKSIAMWNGNTKFTVENTDVNETTIFMLLDSLQQGNAPLIEEHKKYMLDTKISHICFYYPKCVKCGTEPKNSYNGYIPYDPAQSFFTLSLGRLLRGTTQKSSSSTS